MRHRILLMLLLLAPLVGNAQVSFRARIFYPGGHSVSGTYGGPCMIVDGEDTARYMPQIDELDTTDGTVCFTGIARGARCYLYMNGLGMPNYDYPVFTIDEDMTVDSLVLRKMEGRQGVYWSRALHDSAMRADVAALGGDPMARDTHWYDHIDGTKGYWLDDETHALKLAKIYYSDWVFPMASWRTFPHAADSAYRYALMAYDRKATPWLYPALQQLHSHLGHSGEPEVRKPKGPNVMYRPTPYDETSLADSTVDLMTLMERRRWLDGFLEKTLPELGEPSLCCPVAEEGTLRYMAWSPWGDVSVVRLSGRRLYVYRANGIFDKMKLTECDEFYLNDNELAEVRRRMDIFLAAKLPDDMTGVIYVIDGGDYLLEYIHNGLYRTFRVPDGGKPEEFEGLTKYLWGLYGAHSQPKTD